MQPLRGAKVTTKNETLVKSYVNNGEKSVNSMGKENQKKRLHDSKQTLYQQPFQQTKKDSLKFQIHYKPIFSHELCGRFAQKLLTLHVVNRW